MGIDCLEYFFHICQDLEVAIEQFNTPAKNKSSLSNFFYCLLKPEYHSV